MAQTLQLRLAVKQSIAESIVLLELQAPMGGELPPFTPGAHLLLDLPGGLSRAYSLCNDPAERSRYQLAVQLDPGSRGGSRAVHAQLQVGQVLTAAGPRNLFLLAGEPHHAVLVAGGIGITTLLSMARHLQATGKPWELHYATRTAARCAFRDELLTGPLSASSRLYPDDGSTGALDIPALLAAAPAGAQLYVCGPAGLIAHAMGSGRAAGWAEARLHSERFTADVADAAGASTFELVLARTGRSLQVPAGMSVLQVVRAARIDLPSACEQGVCGTCITGVLAGRPNHRDQCLDDGLRATCFTPCCSRSLDASLTIDL